MSVRISMLYDWISRILAGGAFGCAVLFVVAIFIPVPFWEPLYKGDKREKTMETLAKVELPTAFALGALAGLVWWRSRTVSLKHRWLIGCCLIVVLVSALLRPHVARIQRPGAPHPLYEVVPDTMVAVFSIVALALMVSGIMCHVARRRSPSQSGGG